MKRFLTILFVLIVATTAFAQTEAPATATVSSAAGQVAVQGISALPRFNQDFQFQQSVFQPQMPKEAAQNEMMLSQMSNIVFQKFSYNELQAMCPDENKIVATVYDYLQSQDAAANVCSGIEEGLQRCSESKSFCDNIGKPPEGMEGDESQFVPSCPPDETKLAQSCTDRATNQQEEQLSYVKEEIPIKCELEWERNQFHYQARCNEGQNQGQGYGQGTGSQGTGYGQAGPGFGQGGQGTGPMCQNISPPSQEIFKQCADKQGRLEGKRDDKGCITGFECVQGQTGQTGQQPGTECRSPPQEELERQKNDCTAKGGTPQPNLVGSCLEGYNCQVQPATTQPETCAQVITYAIDPTTNNCTSFPTPCNVPQGWQTGCTPTTTGSGTNPQTTGGDTNTITPAGKSSRVLYLQNEGSFPVTSGPMAPNFYNPSGPAAGIGQSGFGHPSPAGQATQTGQQGWNQPQGQQGYGQQGQQYAPGTGSDYGPPQDQTYAPGTRPNVSQSDESRIPKEAFCDKEKFISACSDIGNKAFESAFKQTNVKRICELEAKLNAKQMAQFCKQAQTGKADCVKRTEQACSSVSKQLEKCKSYSTPEKIKGFIKSKVHEMCVSKSFSEQKANYDQGLVGIANSFDLSSAQLPTEYGQWLQGEKSRLVQVTEGVSEVQQQESKKDAVYQLTKMLGAQTQRELAEAKKIKEQATKLGQTITSLKALSEQLTDPAMQATLNEQIKQLEERRNALASSAQGKEKGASGIFGFLSGLFGGPPQAATEPAPEAQGNGGKIPEPPVPQ
ncbi:MAG: hypothetical protein WC602_01015 [archaeon]